MLKSPNNFFFSEITKTAIYKYSLTAEVGFEEFNGSTVEFDIHFLLKPDEVMYIVNALE